MQKDFYDSKEAAEMSKAYKESSAVSTEDADDFVLLALIFYPFLVR